MNGKNEIKHSGIIYKKEQDSLLVKLSETLNCSTCSLKSSCDSNRLKNDIFKIDTIGNGFFQGQKVELVITKKQVFLSVFWAYIFPLFLLVASVSILSILFTELVSGLLSLSVLCLYLLILYLARKKLDKKFSLKLNGL